MNVLIKSLAVIAITLVIAAQVQANDAMNKKQGPHKRPVFSSFDTNTDGDIDLEEFLAHKKPPRKDPKTIFAEIDSDKNGVISQEEFANHKPPHPKRDKGDCRD